MQPTFGHEQNKNGFTASLDVSVSGLNPSSKDLYNITKSNKKVHRIGFFLSSFSCFKVFESGGVD